MRKATELEAPVAKHLIDENYMTSRSTSLSDEPEIIPSRDPIEADKEFVRANLTSLLKSTPITLEDKARVI